MSQTNSLWILAKSFCKPTTGALEIGKDPILEKERMSELDGVLVIAALFLGVLAAIALDRTKNLKKQLGTVEAQLKKLADQD